MFGFLNVCKPPGPTSHDIVAQVRRVFSEKIRVGHAGTLDPFAEGVLVICLGPATRLAGYVQSQPKWYAAEITLGATSSTDDVEGKIVETPLAAAPSQQAVREKLLSFVGEIEQVPPFHSAVHVRGERAYKIARAGGRPSLPARRVTIHEMELVAYEFPLLRIGVHCGSGTYVRSLARDIGNALGVGGYCSRLTRTAVGPFKIEQAVPLERLDVPRDLISPLAALQSLPKVTVDERAARSLAVGRAIPYAGPAHGGEIAVLDEHAHLLCIATLTDAGRTLAPGKVFAHNEP
jgi:tRNA pseudouridine55 synthase